MKTIFFILALSLQTSIVFAQRNVKDYLQLQSTPETYYVKKSQSLIDIDGKDMENAWANAPWTTAFKDIEGISKPKPALETRIKMLWDNENLYLFAKLEESHINGYLKQKDTIIYHDNDFEVFLKPNLQSPEYIEIEVNALNTIMDLLMTKPYRFGGKANLNWDTKGIESAVYHSGTINNPTDRDKFWTVEMKIPVKSLKSFGEGNQIKANEVWKINFSRVQWHYDIKGKNYVKRKDNSGKLLPEENWVWSPIGLINMHFPERWGHIKFVDQEDQQFLDEQFLTLEKTAWNIFYLQQVYKNMNKRYATSLTELAKVHPEIKTVGKQYQLIFSNARNFYRIEIKSKSQPKQKLTIDSQGNIYF
ncbi:carbohydrate-binding family 9-like protein [Sphingobacterium sp. N143]|uniref:carbohydrate-binding family 9-like protein n=1 Tax=Sphingobacterium sp. N143 TaxID=2746727 RepID=UPI0025783F47|nr:carbohydrate-binding family 9-like protein [Sphingobacterium sp. N143]MDM1294716.1 carbohydrate-binding family 9-like protein [Sphingobacterium sp. N143]